MKKKVTQIDSTKIATSNENTKTKINVAAYCRVSTESDEQLNSLAVQRDYFNTLISGHTDWNYVGIYYDEGISGTSTKNRKGFNNMIILIIQPLDENPYFFMQYNGEMPFLTFITMTGSPSIISNSVFTLSIAFGSI